MLQRVQLNGIPLPRLYIAENKSDAELAMSKGIPFIRWTQGQDALIKLLLRPVLEQMFPDIMWNKVLGRRRQFRTQVELYESYLDPSFDDGLRLDEGSGEKADWSPSDSGIDMDMPTMLDEYGNIVEVSDSTIGARVFLTDGDDLRSVRKLDLQDYVGDLSSCVNLEVLQRLKLMPSFIGDILDCVKTNIGNGLYWREGYNKRRSLCVGRFDASRQLPNLVILDVSGSIPRGIAATMILLIDTLRTQLSADLIITSSKSRFYPMGCELPSPQDIRNMFGYYNESRDFSGILSRYIRGRHYDHVISFGDYDQPAYDKIIDDMCGTKVEHVHHYHTGLYAGSDMKTGYAKWCHMLADEPEVSFDTSWCKVIRN